MKIRTKVFLSIIVSLFIGVVVAICTIAMISNNYIEDLELKGIENDLESVTSIMNNEVKVIERTQLDWTHWDDTYEFLDNRNNQYMNDNLGNLTLEQLNLYGMVFIDKDMNVVYEDYLKESETSIVSKFFMSKEELKQLLSGVTKDQSNSGIAMFDNKPFIVSAAGVTTSNGDKTENGYLVIIKKIDDEFITYTESLLNSEISFQSENVLRGNSVSAFELGEITRENENIQYKAYMKGIRENQTISFISNGKRTTYLEAMKTREMIFIIVLMIFIVILITSFLAIHMIVTKKIVGLNEFVHSVISSKDVTIRMKINWKDEISDLGNNINQMLESLEKNFITIKKNDERLHLLMEATNDGYFDYDVSSGEITISEAWITHLGYDLPQNMMDHKKAFDYIHEDDKDELRQVVRNHINNRENGSFYAEVRAYKAPRGYAWILIRGKTVDFDKHGNAIRWVGSLSDISQRKSMENENQYLLQTDPVTQLKNRTYMENLLKDLEISKSNSYCIMMADVNGLKLINDAFGHSEGDRLLSTVGKIFCLCCKETDVPVRWGGDEFLILIKHGQKYADSLLKRIKEEFKKIDSFPLKVTVAMGCSVIKADDISVDQAINRAEEKMYRNKLLESRSIRSGVISSFEQTLNEKQIETHEHTARIRELCLKIADYLGMRTEDKDELALLSLLHDVGKISISDHIFTKKDELTEAEWKQIKIHSEAGYRIARAIPEIAHIADSILYHHENYDGMGYPTGIAGEEIPINSRILSVVHAYDIMKYGANYKSPMNKDEINMELVNKSGEQFDPHIVKILLEIV